MNQQHVLILTLGPVQSFIFEARRTADLSSGSQLLVQLARTIARSLKESGKLVYPAGDDLDQTDMPNKLVAIVEDPQNAAEKAEKAMREQWQTFGREALSKLIDSEDETLQVIWQRQLNHHPEFYWAAAPYDGTQAGYQQAYQLADRALGARKQSRNFAQANEGGFKDSLSGERSALRTGNGKDARTYWQRVQKIYPRQLQSGELLDTLCVIKRFGTTKPAPSTSTMAASSFARLCATEGLLSDTINAITSANLSSDLFHTVFDLLKIGFIYDGDLLYPETYTPQNLANRYNISQAQYTKYKHNFDCITHALADLYAAANKAKLNPGRPSPYYAILQMDGDSMGQHVSQCHTQADHEKLSRILDEFTRIVKDGKDGLVAEYGGYLIYAGGDDVLALFPADKALSAADALQQKYVDLFRKWKHNHTKDSRPFPFTASVGIAFVHHLYPLDGALTAARRAEKQAKNQYGRNALCATVLRRSGETSTVGGKWANTVEIVDNFIKLLETEQISSRFPYSLLCDADVVTAMVNKSAREAILRQLLNRHRTERLAADQPEQLIKVWTQWANTYDELAPPAEEDRCQQNDMQNKPTPTQGFAELVRWLVLAHWLAAGGQE